MIQIIKYFDAPIGVWLPGCWIEGDSKGDIKIYCNNKLYMEYRRI